MLRMDHYNFNVLDLDRSLEFYKNALGFVPKREMKAEDGSFHLVFIGNDDAPFCIELTHLRDRKEPYDLGEGEFHLGIVTDEFEDVYKRQSYRDIFSGSNPSKALENPSRLFKIHSQDSPA